MIYQILFFNCGDLYEKNMTANVINHIIECECWVMRSFIFFIDVIWCCARCGGSGCFSARRALAPSPEWDAAGWQDLSAVHVPGACHCPPVEALRWQWASPDGVEPCWPTANTTILNHCSTDWFKSLKQSQNIHWAL